MEPEAEEVDEEAAAVVGAVVSEAVVHALRPDDVDGLLGDVGDDELVALGVLGRGVAGKPEDGVASVLLVGRVGELGYVRR